VVFFLLFLGLYPSPVTKTVAPFVRAIISITEKVKTSEVDQLLDEEIKVEVTNGDN